MNKLFSIPLLAIVFASCSNSDDSKTNESVSPAPVTITSPPPAPVPGSGLPGNNSNAPVTAGLNPEHGAPGHRCDIPVGTPLNTPVASNPPPPATIKPAPIMMNPQAPAPANSNVRLNPAHGAPGHDCSIPVGQPLKS